MAGGSTNTTVQKADPWSGVQPYLRDVYSMAQRAAQRTPSEPFRGPFSPAPTQQMQEAVTGATNLARNMQGLGAPILAEGLRTLSGQYLDPSAYVRPAVEATVRPVMLRAAEQIIPNLGQQAAAAGAFGDTSHAFQQALVARDVNQLVSDTAVKLLNEAFDRERRLQMLAPQMIAAGYDLSMQPYHTLMNAGVQQQAINAYPINEALAAWRESIEAPWRGVEPYARVLSGVGTMGAGEAISRTPGQSPLSGALAGAAGLGALGLGLGTISSGMLAGMPWAIPLALAGGLLGVFR